MFVFLLLLFLLLFITVYFIPSFIAIGRKHVHVLQITILNTFLGWSFLGWVAALIWSTMCDSDEKAQVKASWIIIGVFFLLSVSPLLLYSLIPSQYKSSLMEETQYKKVVYQSPSGKMVKEIEIKKEDKD